MTKYMVWVLLLISLVLVGVAGCGSAQPQLPQGMTPLASTDTAVPTLPAETPDDTDSDSATTEEPLPDATAAITETTTTMTTTATLETEPSPAAATPTLDTYPMPTFRPSSTPVVYPVPDDATATPTMTATPTKDEMTDDATGAIIGKLHDMDGKPIHGIKVFLADIGEGEMISFNPSVSKSGFVNHEGVFFLRNVEPGQYSIAVWTPMSDRLLPDPQRGGESAILVTVMAGEVTDVGLIEIERP